MNKRQRYRPVHIPLYSFQPHTVIELINLSLEKRRIVIYYLKKLNRIEYGYTSQNLHNVVVVSSALPVELYTFMLVDKV